MSFQAWVYVVEWSTADKPIPAWVQSIMANYHDEETGVIGPVGYAKLAKHCRCSASTVAEAIHHLVEIGEVAILDGGGRGRGNAKAYEFPRMPEFGKVRLPVPKTRRPQNPQGVDGNDPQAGKLRESSEKGTGRDGRHIGRSLIPDPPTRARARANGDDQQAPSTYQHDPSERPGHDPADCALCSDHHGKPAPAEARRSWREAVGAQPSDWPDGPAVPPPGDPEAERARQKAVLAELIERGGERP